MEFFECIESRRSFRAYKSEPVEDWKLDKILDAARLAPTAANKQSFRVLVLKTAGREEELKTIYDKAWFAAAPLVLLVSSFPEGCWRRSDGRNYGDVDAAIAMDHMILAATSLGLGTCWVANFNPAAAREVLGLQPGWEPILMTPLGYALDSPAPRPRKALSELVEGRSPGA
jgi:nitroreductase